MVCAATRTLASTATTRETEERMKQLTRSLTALLGLAGLLVLVMGAANAQDDKDQEKAPPKYVGVKTCKKCHNKSSGGKQYKVWESKKHSKAFELLKSERSKEVATKEGIKGNPWEAPECLKCHTTAFGLDKKKHHGPKFDPENGVSCEACHGPGEFFAKPKDGKLHKEAHGKGYLTPTEELCRKCHNETSPTWNPEADTNEAGEKVGFDYPKRLKMILHPIPKEEEKK